MHMNKPLVSIIVPIYNVEKYLQDCIDSLVRQDYPAIEILLIDDGSTDSSSSICKDYANCYNNIFYYHKQNGGLSSARNYGIEKSIGKYIIFIDSDDYLIVDSAISSLIESVLVLGVDILRYEYKAVDENGEFLYVRDVSKKVFLQGKVLSNFSMVRNAIAGEWFAWLYVIKSDVIKNLRFDESRRFQEDIDFYVRLFALRSLKCGYVSNRCYAYRKRRHSLTSTHKIVNLRDSFALSDVFYETSRNIKDNNLRDLYLFYSIMMYYWTLQTLAAVPYYDNREDIIKELELDALHNRVLSRLKYASVDWKYRVFIYPKPRTGVMILRLKDKIRALFS